MIRIALFSVLFVALSNPASARQEPARLTVKEALALPGKLKPDYPRSIGWLDGDTYIAHGRLDQSDEEGEKELLAIDAATGTSRPLFDREKMVAALEQLPGVSGEDAPAWSSRASYQFADDHSGVLLHEKEDLFYYRLGASRAERLTADPAEEVGQTISPDGTMVAYISAFNLHVVGTDGSAPRALTSGGHENLLLGRLDWVYQEEVYGRGDWQAYWWSPDSRRIAFLALDESPVPEFTIVDHAEVHPEIDTWRYPKAGDPNPRVRLGVVDAGGGAVRWIDLSRYAGDEPLVVRVGWTPDSAQVIAQVQDRIQTWLDVVAADPRTGAPTVLLRDRTGTWIEPTDAPFWTGDGQQFLWLSERDGFRHLYLYRRDGSLVRNLTEGRWEVDEVHGIDDRNKLVYFSGDRDDVKGRQLFRVGLDGTGLARLTEEDGTHSVSMSPSFRLFIDDWSSLNDPGHATVRGADGSRERLLAEGTIEPLEKYRLDPIEFATVETRDGFVMEAMLIKPPGFDPSRRYPVLCYTYGGPHSPSVKDRLGRGSTFWHQMLAQHGFLIWICDNRSASGKGHESTRGIYHNLGAQELADLEDGVDWLISQGYADPDRIGIWGWSYGGFMTTYALTHSEKFKLGVAVAPVTDWRLYDSIYTERYMDRPQANPEGYQTSSVLKAAANLHGKLLLIHGTTDENVHLQNSMQLVRALQNAGKEFRLMVYPGNRHGIRKKKQRQHLFELMARFIRDEL